jgi:biotin carboxylase
MPVEAARNCRDKRRTRQVLATAGVPQPESVAVASLDEATRQAARIGYPVVLKPRGLGASQGVVCVTSPGEVAEGYAAASEATQPGAPSFTRHVLVEEYLDGPEISVDGAIVDGQYHPLFLARKSLGPAPFFEETGHLVDSADPLLGSAELLQMLAAAHRALGVVRGITHTEVRLTSRGPRIVEVNGRLGGGFIPYLGMLATGVDPGRVAARIACGEPTSPGDDIPTRHGAVGIRFLYPPEDCRVGKVSLPAPGAFEGLRECVATVGPGVLLRLPPRGYLARYAYAICEGPTAQECAGRLNKATAAIHLDHAPAPPFDPANPDYAWYRLAAAANAAA